MRNLYIAIFLLLIFTGTGLLAQKNTNSPYSRFGLGEMSRKGFEKSRAMGGIGLGMRDNDQINYLNPASYTELDTLSFMFNFGLSSSFTKYRTSIQNDQNFTINLDHLAIAFPVTKWWKTSFGVMPFSSVGYSVTETGYLENDVAVDYFYEGVGGINQLYLGSSFHLYEGLDIGFNAFYLFGSLDLSRTLQFPLNSEYSVSRLDQRTIVHDFTYQLGLQYSKTFAEDYTFTLGGVYHLKTNVSADNSSTSRNIFNGNAVNINDSTNLTPEFILEDLSDEGEIAFPSKYGVGFTFKYSDRFLVGFDYYSQDWSKSSFFNQEQPLTNSNSMHAGLEITPNPEAFRGFHKRIHYRLGGHYENSYLKLQGEQLQDYGIGFGVGLPFRNTKTSFNFAVDMGRRGTLNNNLIEENYTFFSFSVTLHDFWFLQRKFD
ncbi:MAG: hypothetical protein ISS19_03570 [Bacteroidales bacterium]|nr:hypothetical protein [Bacteroidales bacterium]